MDSQMLFAFATANHSLFDQVTYRIVGLCFYVRAFTDRNERLKLKESTKTDVRPINIGRHNDW